MNDLAARVATANFPRFGPATHKKLRELFPSYNDVWNADPSTLFAIPKIPRASIEAFLAFRHERSPESWMDEITTHRIEAISFDDPRYPRLLKHIHTAPSVLFAQGTVPHPKWTPVAMVGSRHCTKYGREAAETIAKACALGGLTVVSGGAYGIDEAAHRGAVAANGLTIAVLGAGLLHRPTSREHALRTHIIDGGGAIMSELPLTAPGHPRNFPVRNRLVAGMTTATIVVEAARPSGTLYTADSALKEGRDLFVVPGPITSPMSRGAHQLIKEGAAIICEPSDIFEGLGITQPTAPIRPIAPKPATPEAQLVLNLLTHEHVHIDEIARKTGLSASVVSASLSLLEIDGSARHFGGMYYGAA